MLVNKKITVLIILFLAVIFLFPVLAHAQTDLGTNDLVESGLGTNNIKDIVVNIVNIALGFLGILATLIILYGGWLWMTSRGESDQIDKAKQTISAGVIGLVIILASYGIARFVIKQIYDATGGGPGGGGGGGGGYHGGIGLGGGVIESHYPTRNAGGIPRNTNIYITFKEPIMDSGSGGLVTSDNCDYSLCPSDNFQITDVATGDIVPNGQIEATRSDNKMVFGFDPYGDSANYLGQINGETQYEILLKPALQKANEDPALDSSGYDWTFTVSNQVDLTPPRITSVIPVPNSTGNPRNVVVQINFSEAVNPLLAAGEFDGAAGFTNITTSGPGNLTGSYLISNQYRTVEFITNELCGTNSCGGEVYCLPCEQDINVVVTDAIEDMAANSLDGDNDGQAGGQYTWSFRTNDVIDLIPPEIISMEDNNDVPLDQPIGVTFSKALLGASIKSDNINYTKADGSEINYWLSLDDDKLFVHSSDLQTLTNYQPTLTSGIKDTRQNCWYPCACNADDGSCLCSNNTVGTDCPGSHCQVGE